MKTRECVPVCWEVGKGEGKRYLKRKDILANHPCWQYSERITITWYFGRRKNLQASQLYKVTGRLVQQLSVYSRWCLENYQFCSLFMLRGLLEIQ